MDVSEEEEEFVEERVNLLYGSLTGLVLGITTRFNNEYRYDVQLSKSERNGKTEFELAGGYAIDLFFYLQSFLNFTYFIRSDIQTMNFDKQSIANDSIDLYLASFSLRIDRVEFVDPTVAIGQSRILAFMDHKFEVESNRDLFIRPFTTRLWICTLIMLFIFLVVFIVFNKFENNCSTGDVVFHCISLILQKGSDVIHFQDSLRLLGIALSIMVLIIMTSYSGIMTSIFTVHQYTISSVPALIESNYKILLEFGAFPTRTSSIKMMLTILAKMGIRQAHLMIKEAEKSKFVYSSFEDAIDRVLNSPSAYVIDEETGLDTISIKRDALPCSMARLSVFNLRYPWVMYMRKNAAFKRNFNAGIVRARERGILIRIRKKWISLPTSSSCDTPYETISFSQVRSAFVFLIVIIVMGLCPIVLLIELGVFRFYKKNDKFQTPINNNII